MHTTSAQVLHYAGGVRYSVEGFLVKNRDTLSPDLVALMQARARECWAGWGSSSEGSRRRWLLHTPCFPACRCRD